MVRQKFSFLVSAVFPAIAMGHDGDHGDMSAVEVLAHDTLPIGVALSLLVSALVVRSVLTRRRVVHVRD